MDTLGGRHKQTNYRHVIRVVSLKTILEIKNSDEPCNYTVNIIKILHRSRLNFKKKRKIWLFLIGEKD